MFGAGPSAATSVAAGDVSSTSPFAGEPEPPGTPINIFVSSGPPKKTVPDVTGDTASAARAALESAGFLVAVSTKTTSAAPAGTVFSQSPPGGAQATAGSTITIVIAQKPPPPAKLTVPSVIGETAAEAKGQLSAAGFTVNEVTQTVKNKSKNGIVLSQIPGAGTKVTKHATVTIVVGSFQPPPPPTTTTTTTHTNTNPGGGPARLP